MNVVLDVGQCARVRFVFKPFFTFPKHLFCRSQPLSSRKMSVIFHCAFIPWIANVHNPASAWSKEYCHKALKPLPLEGQNPIPLPLVRLARARSSTPSEIRFAIKMWLVDTEIHLLSKSDTLKNTRRANRGENAMRISQKYFDKNRDCSCGQICSKTVPGGLCYVPVRMV